MSADVRRYPKAIVTVTETSSMHLVYVVEIVQQTPMPMAFVTTWTNASAQQTHVAYVTDREISMNVGVRVFLKAIVIVMETSLTLSAYVVEIAPRMRMEMGFVMTKTNV